MNDLISRDELISDLAYVPPELLIDRNYLYAKIMKLHTVDAAPVVHARWKPLQEDVYWGNSLKRMYCDVCNNQAIFDSQRRKFILTCFCPNCGAKMDGEA